MTVAFEEQRIAHLYNSRRLQGMLVELARSVRRFRQSSIYSGRQGTAVTGKVLNVSVVACGPDLTSPKAIHFSCVTAILCFRQDRGRCLWTWRGCWVFFVVGDSGRCEQSPSHALLSLRIDSVDVCRSVVLLALDMDEMNTGKLVSIPVAVRPHEHRSCVWLRKCVQASQ